jgi:hypothetical protein
VSSDMVRFRQRCAKGFNSGVKGLISALDKMVGQCQAPVALPSGRDPVPHCTGGCVGPRAGLNWCGNLALSSIRSMDRTARSKSLFRLGYLSPSYIQLPSQSSPQQQKFSTRMPVVFAAAGQYSTRMPVASGAPERGPRPDCIALVFVFLARIITCAVYKLSLSDQAQITQQPKISFFRCNVKIFSRSALARKAQNFFPPGPKPALGCPDDLQDISGEGDTNEAEQKKTLVFLVWLGPIAPLLQLGEEQNHSQGN